MTWRELPVDGTGSVDVDALAGLIDAETALVAVMLANNETGVVQPLDRVADDGPRAADGTARVFTDAVQATSFLDLAETHVGRRPGGAERAQGGGTRWGSACWPSGRPTDIVAHQHGGGQERERRSGTQDVVGAVGLAAALRLAAAERIGDGAAGRRPAGPAGRRARRGGPRRCTARCPRGWTSCPGTSTSACAASSARSSCWP